MHVVLGMRESDRSAAARLYWEAFGGKLGRILGPEPRALRFLERAIRADHCFTATSDDGTLIGIAGFKSLDGSFASGTPDDLVMIYGQFGAFWRRSLMALLQTEIDNDRFLIDGICVAREWRGRGVGSALVEALIAEARWRGYPSVRLEVIDANVRARALYERLGFAPWRSETLGLLRHVFGFTRSTTMVRDLSAKAI